MTVRNRTIGAMVLAAAAMAMGACTSTADTAVPRRTAYPRIALYDSVYTTLSQLPVSLTVNSQIACDVEQRADGAWWVNLHYGRYGVTVYCTLTPVDASTVDAVIDNRAERLHRNISQAQPEITDVDSPAGYHSNLVVARGGSSAPVQFLSVRPEDPRWVLSGSAMFDAALPAGAADSVAPVVDALIRDVNVMLNALGANTPR